MTRLRGFTMVEMLLVVAIIATIALIVVPRMVGRGEQAKIVATQAEISSICTALDTFELDVGRFPATEEGLAALIERPASLSAEDRWNGPYHRELPLDPWKREYVYRYPGEQSVDYDLISLGPDGEQGTEDDVTNYRRKEQTR